MVDKSFLFRSLDRLQPTTSDLISSTIPPEVPSTTLVATAYSSKAATSTAAWQNIRVWRISSHFIRHADFCTVVDRDEHWSKSQHQGRYGEMDALK